MGLTIGVDYGVRRIGIATADSRGIIVTPADCLAGTGSASGDADLTLKWATEHEAAEIVVGLPLNMDGTDSAQTRATRAFADELRQRSPVPVELYDERLSSFQADLLLDEADVRRSRRKKLRDALAAQVILQSFLDARRGDKQAGATPDAAPD